MRPQMRILSNGTMCLPGDATTPTSSTSESLLNWIRKTTRCGRSSRPSERTLAHPRPPPPPHRWLRLQASVSSNQRRIHGYANKYINQTVVMAESDAAVAATKEPKSKRARKHVVDVVPDCIDLTMEPARPASPVLAARAVISENAPVESKKKVTEEAAAITARFRSDNDQLRKTLQDQEEKIKQLLSSGSRVTTEHHAQTSLKMREIKRLRNSISDGEVLRASMPNKDEEINRLRSRHLGQRGVGVSHRATTRRQTRCGMSRRSHG